MSFNAETLAFLSVLLFLIVVLSNAHDDDQQQQQQQQGPPILQSRAPHGLAFESPISFPPSAFEFFHPRPAGAKAAHAPLPLSMARADRAVESARSTPEISTGGIRSGVVATVLGVACVVLVAVGTSYYYLVIKSKSKSKRASTLIQFHSNV